MQTTVGQLLLNEILPPDLRDYNRPITKKSLQALLREVATKYPDRYNDIAKQLMDLGGEVVTVHGNEASLSLDNLKVGTGVTELRKKLRSSVNAVLASNLSDDEKNKRIEKLVGSAAPELRKVNFAEQLAARNALAMQVDSGARGNTIQFASTNIGDLQVQDHRDNVIPIPLLNSYAEGLDPVEYWAGSYGARKGAVDLKFATPKGGFLGKQLALAAHRQLVTEHDCGTTNGIPVDSDDDSNEGALLARSAADFDANTILDSKTLKRLARDTKEIIVRSPITCQARDGVCARCVGIRERGKLPAIGDNVGIAAAQAISEPITQQAISSKHCLAEGTLVRMADYSTKAIETIEIGDMVLGSDHTGVTRPVRVVATYDNGERECIESSIRLNASAEITKLVSTPEHKVLMRHRRWDGKVVRKGGIGNFTWRYELRPIGDPVRTCQLLRPREFVGSELKHEPRALLLGLMLGDGCFTKAVHGPHFSCADPGLVFELSQYFSTLNLRLHLLSGQKIYYRVSSVVEAAPARDGTTGRILPGARNPTTLMLQEFGAWEKYAHEKEIPAAAYGWDNQSIANLLAGLFITDGSVYLGNQRQHLHIAFGVTSERLTQQVRELLAWRFGIYGTTSVNSYGGRKRSVYYLKITNPESVQRFVDSIPLRGKKKEKIEKWRSRLGIQRYRNINRMALIAQVPVGRLRTYDIEVDHPDHLFVLANGAIVSNSGGVAGGSGPTASGFDAINQLTQVPKTFKGGAAIAKIDGTVEGIESAPQGGHYILVSGQKHYVAPEFDPLVVPGDKVEAGDVISQGLPNPGEIAKHKGVGLGRWHFMKVFRDTLRASNISANRRNIELLARGLVNHARIVDPDGVGDMLPDDVVEYSTLIRDYKQRVGTKSMEPKKAVGMYLETPILQYSIGTKVTPRIAADLRDRKIATIKAHPDEPIFSPEMVRAQEVLGYNEDWMVRMGGFQLKKNLLKSVHRGLGSEEHSVSFIPPLARTTGFGLAPVKPGEPAGAKY